MIKSEMLGASAGSGKTYRLTERIYDSIRTENPLVIAVTFTRAATAEMRKRILDRVDLSPVDYHCKLQRIMRAGDVHFSTYDAFFYQILASLGEPVQIADEKQTGIIREKIEKSFFNEIDRADKSEEIIIACRLLGVSIEKLAEELSDVGAGRFKKNDVSDNRITRIIAETARLKEQIRRVLDALKAADSEKLAKRVRQYVIELSGLAIGDLTRRTALSYRDLSEWSWLGKKIPWSEKPYSDLNRVFTALRPLLAAYLLNRAVLRETTLTEMHKIYELAAEKIKRRERKIFFEDILSRLIALDGRQAVDRPEVMGLYFELGLDRVRHLMIDEFQDTSRDNLELVFPLMEEILSEVGENGEGERSLFLVGDWKQMIYAWRGASREAVENRLVPYRGGQLRQSYLRNNWRSTPLLIDLFNRTVARIFPGSDPDEQQLPPSDKVYEGLSEIHLCRVAVEKNRKAVIFDRMVDTIRDRKARWGCDHSDMTLIFRTNAEKETMAQKLVEAGIGFSEVRGRQILASEEGVAVFCLLAYLFAGEGLLFFEKSLAASSFCDGLMRIAGQKDRIVSRYGAPYGLQAIADTLEMCRGFLPDPVIEAFGEEAENFFRTGGISAKDFLSHIFTVRDKVTVAEPAHSDRVKLATIHGAKGLEFPHVFLLWMEQNKPCTFHVPDFKCHMSFNKHETAFWRTVDSAEAESIVRAGENEREKIENEKANLLYVAMTRATHSISIFLKKTSEEGGGAAGNDGEDDAEDRLSGKLVSIVEEGAFDAECLRGQDSVTWRRDFGPPRKKELGDMVEIAPLRRPAVPRVADEVGELDRSLVAQEIREGIERGEKIHTYLAALGDSHSPERHGLSSAEQKAVESFLADPKVADILFRPGKVFIEQAISNRYFYGVVDRMIVDDERVTLIDYKTGAPGDLLDSYREQLQRYGNIMKSLYPERAVEGYLLFIDEREKVMAVDMPGYRETDVEYRIMK